MSKSTLLVWFALVLVWGIGGVHRPPRNAVAAQSTLAAPPPSFTVVAASAFLRAEPRVQAPATYSVFQGDTFPILGRKADNSWLQIDYPKATKGTWILASLGKVTGDLSAVPVTAASSNASVASTPTVPPVPTAIVVPTLTPGSPALSEICVLLYHDSNGNGQHDPKEEAIAGGQLTLLDPATGGVIQTYTTTPKDTGGHCFKDLPAGAYTVAATAPAGFNATMEGSLLQRALAGQQYKLTFGAQPQSGARRPGPQPNTTLVTGLGMALLLLAAGLAAFFIIRRR